MYSKVLMMVGVGLLTFSVTAKADLDLKSKKIQNILCARMQRELPSEDGRTVSIRDCRENGTFTISETKKDRWVVEYQNSSLVEDTAVVCEVEFAKDKKDIKKLKKASCDLS